jgi:hypothetical protein
MMAVRVVRADSGRRFIVERQMPDGVRWYEFDTLDEALAKVRELLS